VQLQALETLEPSIAQPPPDLQQLLQQFDSVFTPPSELPPKRSGDHQIPLLDGAQPFCLRPYRYNLA
jgi:hypothetical protein